MEIIEQEKTRKLVRVKNFFDKKIKPNWILYVFLIPGIIYALIFMYYPIYGLTIAFKRFNPGLGITGSPWVGLMHFKRFFSAYNSWALIKNTFVLSFYSYLTSIPFPIILAIALNYCYHQRFKKLVQTITYAPHFISTVVVVSMLFVFLSPRNGMVNILLMKMGLEPIAFMMEESWFRHLFVASNVWQHTGFNAIIYMAVLAGVDPQLHEAAIVDGASKIKRVWHIDIPYMMPTFIILQILALGRIMNIGFEKVLLMQTAPNMNVSEIIATYVYRMGIQMGEFSYTTAVGLFNNLINLVLLLTANYIANKMSDVSVI